MSNRPVATATAVSFSLLWHLSGCSITVNTWFFLSSQGRSSVYPAPFYGLSLTYGGFQTSGRFWSSCSECGFNVKDILLFWLWRLLSDFRSCLSGFALTTFLWKVETIHSSFTYIVSLKFFCFNVWLCCYEPYTNLDSLLLALATTVDVFPCYWPSFPLLSKPCHPALSARTG